MIRRLLVPLVVVVVAVLGGAMFFVWPAINHSTPSPETAVSAAARSDEHQEPGQSAKRPAQATANDRDPEQIPPPGPDTVEACMLRERMAPASAAGATTLLVYDHEIGAPITMDLRTWCQETIALSPAPGGNLAANFTVSGGHVHADYYLVDRSSFPRLNGSVPVSLPAQVKIPDEEAQAILAEQARQGLR